MRTDEIVSIQEKIEEIQRALAAEQVELMRLAIANYRRVRKLLEVLDAQTSRLIDLNAPE